MRGRCGRGERRRPRKPPLPAGMTRVAWDTSRGKRESIEAKRNRAVVPGTSASLPQIGGGQKPAVPCWHALPSVPSIVPPNPHVRQAFCTKFMGSVAPVRSREAAAKNRYDNARRCNRPNLRLQAGIFYFLVPV